MAPPPPTASTSSPPVAAQQPQPQQKIVLKSLSILLGLFFIFIGLLKVTTMINKELHKDMRKEFVKYSKVFPLASTLGFKLSSKWYRRSIGGIEILCGFLLAVSTSALLKRAMNLILLTTTVLGIYSHLLVDQKFERTAPSLVFFFMLTCRLVVEWQQERAAEKKRLRDLAAAAELQDGGDGNVMMGSGSRIKENGEKMD